MGTNMCDPDLAALAKLCEDINEVLTEIRYEAVELDPPA
jgi:hypothetical protein